MVSDPRVVWMPGGVRTEVQLDSRDTAGAFCLLVDEPPAGWALPTHLHRDHAETIHVVSGEFEVDLDGATTRLGAGQTVHVPVGVRHASRNVGDAPGRRVLLFSPGGMEGFFLQAGAGTPTAEIEPDRLRAVASRHGWEFEAPS
jgi:mannose-6-phosphate isomerase-like protein (cupin superfamily)